MKKIMIHTAVALLGLMVVTGCSSKESPEPKDAESKEVVTAEMEESGIRMEQSELDKILENNTDVKSYFEEFLGEKYEDIQMKDVEGVESSLKSLVDGKNTVLEFMGTWCPVCEEAAPHIDEFNKSTTLDVQAVSIAINDTEETLKAFAEDKETEYFLPLEDDVMEKYKLQFVPIYFFIDSEGTIQLVLSGVLDVDTLEQMSIKAFGIE